MHLIIPWLHHLIMIHFMHALDHVHMEPKSDVLAEQAIAEDPANTKLTPGKPRCIPPIILIFAFESLLYHKLDCELSL
jgi:hypothetical protein